MRVFFEGAAPHRRKRTSKRVFERSAGGVAFRTKQCRGAYQQFVSCENRWRGKSRRVCKGYDNVNISYACTVSANTSDGKFVPVKLGQGTATSKFGPEVGIAEKISALDLAKRVYVIKYAYGGTTLTTQWRSPSSKNTGGLYTGAVQYVNEQLKNSKSKTCIPSSRLYAGCRASRTPTELVTILTRNWSATSSKIYAKNLRFISRPIPR